MPLYEKTGMEDDLMLSCVVVQLTIEVLEDRDCGKYAEGSITAKDYAEGGFTFTNKWQATRVAGGGDVVAWIVIKDPDDDPFWTGDDGEVNFTANSAVNDSMKQYIAHHLDEHMAGAKSSSGPAVYEGEMHEYTGDCVCCQLALSSSTRPFQWAELTETAGSTRRTASVAAAVLGGTASIRTDSPGRS